MLKLSSGAFLAALLLATTLVLIFFTSDISAARSRIMRGKPIKYHRRHYPLGEAIPAAFLKSTFEPEGGNIPSLTKRLQSYQMVQSDAIQKKKRPFTPPPPTSVPDWDYWGDNVIPARFLTKTAPQNIALQKPTGQVIRLMAKKQAMMA